MTSNKSIGTFVDNKGVLEISPFLDLTKEEEKNASYGQVFDPKARTNSLIIPTFPIGTIRTAKVFLPSGMKKNTNLRIHLHWIPFDCKLTKWVVEFSCYNSDHKKKHSEKIEFRKQTLGSSEHEHRITEPMTVKTQKFEPYDIIKLRFYRTGQNKGEPAIISIGINVDIEPKIFDFHLYRAQLDMWKESET